MVSGGDAGTAKAGRGTAPTYGQVVCLPSSTLVRACSPRGDAPAKGALLQDVPVPNPGFTSKGSCTTCNCTCAGTLDPSLLAKL